MAAWSDWFRIVTTPVSQLRIFLEVVEPGWREKAEIAVDWMLALALLALPWSLAWGLTGLVIRLAPRWGLVDRPAARKFHQRITPLGGGLAIALAVLGTLSLVVLVAWLVQQAPAVAVWMPNIVQTHAPGIVAQSGQLGWLLLLAGLQLGLGLIDDWKPGGLDYRLRLVVEVLLVSGLMMAGIRLSVFTQTLWLTVPLTLFWMVGLINAINFLDNMDGLAGGISLIACLFFAVILYQLQNYFVAGCFWVLAGALLGFLRFNWPPAKLFMGDAGSNFLGFFIGALVVIGTFSPQNFPHVTILAPLCVLAVPIYDSTVVIGLRLWQGRSPFHPDKQHFSHRLVDLGLPSKYAVIVIYLVTFTTGLGGLLLYQLPAEAAGLVILQIICTLGIIAVLEFTAWNRRQKLESKTELSPGVTTALESPETGQIVPMVPTGTHSEPATPLSPLAPEREQTTN